ncbi:peptidoglycan endopeptidase [Sphingomonas echinoides]|jgi:cell wall-associated NlpC family hydrolase|uniref:peptidoglycan endopeptidase n=1 Tax=Sphingomonas echinoides TaxID=59803 RepID=UPI003EED6447
MSAGERAVAAARGAIGARFRVQRRDPAFGLDCVGLAGLAARAAGFEGEIPSGYALRGGDAVVLAAAFSAAGLVASDVPAPGDLALFLTGPGQFHLAVLVPGGIVHADAMLRRVVERPGVPPWPVLGCWRVEG